MAQSTQDRALEFAHKCELAGHVVRRETARATSGGEKEDGMADYPAWICADCGERWGRRPAGNPHGATWHMGTCDICDEAKAVTEPRDYGHLREGWEK